MNKRSGGYPKCCCLYVGHIFLDVLVCLALQRLEVPEWLDIEGVVLHPLRGENKKEGGSIVKGVIGKSGNERDVK